MSKRELGSVGSLIVVATPAPRGAGRYQARIDGGDCVLCVSRTPFFDAARELLTIGYDPNLTLILRHTGADTDSLRARLGTATSLTVEETGYGPQLRRWKPLPTLAVAPRNAPTKRGATTPALPPPHSSGPRRSSETPIPAKV